MTKHDRLMNALREIKEVCSKNEDPHFGCGQKCPFLMADDGSGFRDCEVVTFIQGNTINKEVIVPQAWNCDYRVAEGETE